MKRLTIKELFRQIDYCYNALAIQYDMGLHDKHDMDELIGLINQYQADFKKEEQEWEEWKKQHAKNV